jgi:amidohydrolase
MKMRFFITLIEERSLSMQIDHPFISPDKLSEIVEEVLPEITSFRRSLHQIPEVKFEEKKTAEAIRRMVENVEGLEPRAPLIGTDVVAVLQGGADGGGKNVTLRADIDALPLAEKSGVAWASKHPDVAHACGHDGHSAILVGVLRVLSQLVHRLPGSVRFVFQPAEEGGGGGKQLVEKGLLSEEPKADAVYALHGWAGLPEGVLSTRAGVMMAAADVFSIEVIGKGGHGAKPQNTVDPIVIGAQLVGALQSVVSRNVDPNEPAVLSVCSIHGGKTNNVVPERLIMEGTTRYFKQELRDVFRGRIQEVAKGICEAAGATAHVVYNEGYIPLANDEKRAAFAEAVIKRYLGENAWKDNLERTMGAEDFAYYLNRVPGVFLRLGLGENSAELHSPSFDFNDSVIKPGILTLCSLTLETLAGQED